MQSAEILNSTRKPPWLKRPIAFQGKQETVRRRLAESGLHTVCHEARCPNRSECFARGTMTFLVMGPVCTRACRFCSVSQGSAYPLDYNEIGRVVETVRKMNLHHVVVTSVTRDDLPDGGAGFFADLVTSFRHALPEVVVELLIPDLKGEIRSLSKVFGSRPDILNHNVETVPSLYPSIRPQADYDRSLAVLSSAVKTGLVAKSGIMVGLGETPEEVDAVLDDLRKAGCSIVTIGQYLQPTPQQIEVKQYVSPQMFGEYERYGREKGIKCVIAGPFVRSSYKAADIMSRLAQ